MSNPSVYLPKLGSVGRIPLKVFSTMKVFDAIVLIVPLTDG